MLNIGKLSPGGGEYYIGEIATSAEDYYTGNGEADGRWVGSLAADLGLAGAVDPEHFRRVLLGQDPFTGETLLSPHAARLRHGTTSPSVAAGRVLDVPQAASFLGVSAQYVRFLLKQGEEHRERLAGASPQDHVQEPPSHLLGQRHDGPKGTGAWTLPIEELERHAAGRAQPKARPGFDLTLRPPKGVSVLWALSGDERRRVIRAAHAEAVDEVVRYYEDHVVRARSSERHRALVGTDGVIAAAFDHRASRAGDPLLHSHVVVANFTRIDGGDEAGAWRALFSPALFEHAKAGGHLYQAHLRRRLTEWLGVEFGPVVNGYADVQGIPDTVIEIFSKRRTEIEDVLAESGLTSARAAQVATLDTRRSKEYGVDAETLRERWHADATDGGFDVAALERCFGRVGVEAITGGRIERLYARLAGAEGLTERASTFRRTEVIEAVASATGGSCTAPEVESLADGFLGSAHVVPVVDVQASTDEVLSPEQPRVQKASPTQYLYTTRELAVMEADLLRWANNPAAVTAVDPIEIQRVLDARPELSDEQADMVEAASAPDRLLTPIAGRPGAGKTYATEAVVAAHVASGVPILGCAVSATAAAELERAAGFSRSVQPATTLARLLVDLDRSPSAIAPGACVVLDEASMVGTRDLHRLVRHFIAAQGAVLLIGDPDQHGSVDVGGVFQRLCRDRGDDLVRLVDNNRQIEQSDRLAIDDYRQGHIAEALGRYDDAGHVVRSRTAGESLDAMVADWYADWLEGHADPMIAGPNSLRRALNDRARAVLKAEGHLHGDALVIGGREFMVGDEVVARRNDRRLRNVDTGEFVKNGSAGVVANLDRRAKRITVAFDHEGTITLPTAYLAAGRLEHAYARTTYGVQGATHDTTRYHPTDGSGFEEGYVALTRGRRATKVYVVAGTIEEEDELSHLPAEQVAVGLGDIVDSLGRRRANAMAADRSISLADVARAGLAPDHIDAEIAELRAALADRPRDHRHQIRQITIALDAVVARQRLHGEQPDGATASSARAEGKRDALQAGLAAARARLEHRLATSLAGQQSFEEWESAHQPEITRLAVLESTSVAVAHQQALARSARRTSAAHEVDIAP